MAMGNYGQNKPAIKVSQKMFTATGHPVEIFRVDDTYIYGIIDFVDDVPEIHRWWLSGISPNNVDWSLRPTQVFTVKSLCETKSGKAVRLFAEIDEAIHGAYLDKGEWLPLRWSTSGEAIYADESEGLDLCRLKTNKSFVPQYIKERYTKVQEDQHPFCPASECKRGAIQ
jgi:hypothetical protein